MAKLSHFSPKRLGHSRPAAFPLGPPTWPGGVERPALEKSLGVDYDTEWSRRWPARVARAVMLEVVTTPVMQVLATPRVRGLDRLADLEAPVIFAANHSSHLDLSLLLVCMPERFRRRCVVAAAADYFFDRRWKAAMWALAIAAIPIERTRVSRRGSELATELLGGDWNLVIFPEGGRSRDGWGQPFRGGAAYLAKKADAPVVPVYMQGTRRILARGASRIRRSPTTVTFGPALWPAADEDARRFSVRIEAGVAALADEVTTDWWSARRRAAAGTTPDLTGPDASPWRRAWALDQGDQRRSGKGAPTWPPLGRAPSRVTMTPRAPG